MPEEAGFEETRSLIAGLNGTMHGLSNLRVCHNKTPETSVSGVLVFGHCECEYIRFPPFAKGAKDGARGICAIPPSAKGAKDGAPALYR